MSPQILHSRPLGPAKGYFPETVLPLEKRSPETGGHLLQDGGASQRWDVCTHPGLRVGIGGNHLGVVRSIFLWNSFGPGTSSVLAKPEAVVCFLGLHKPRLKDLVSLLAVTLGTRPPKLYKAITSPRNVRG